MFPFSSTNFSDSLSHASEINCEILLACDKCETIGRTRHWQSIVSAWTEWPLISRTYWSWSCLLHCYYWEKCFSKILHWHSSALLFTLILLLLSLIQRRNQGQSNKTDGVLITMQHVIHFLFSLFFMETFGLSRNASVIFFNALGLFWNTVLFSYEHFEEI